MTDLQPVNVEFPHCIPAPVIPRAGILRLEGVGGNDDAAFAVDDFNDLGNALAGSQAFRIPEKQELALEFSRIGETGNFLPGNNYEIIIP